MTVQQQIDGYFAAQPSSKRDDLMSLDRRIRRIAPDCKLWFLDGRNDDGKIVTNPNVGYGSCTIRYAGGETKEFYRVGLSANTGGVSVYVMGVADKEHLAETYGARLGKAKVTGYCVRFKALKDVNADVLEEMIASHMAAAATSAA